MSRWVITDIHGCYYSFKALLEREINLRPQDTLYLLGDYISKGPFSKQVLDFIMQLQEQGYDLRLLRGNHEQEVLHVLEGRGSLAALRQKGVFTFLKNFDITHPAELPERYIQFFHSLEWYFSLEDWLLVHAGFDFTAADPFQESDQVVNIRDYEVDLDKTSGRKIIHGHSPTDLAEIEQALSAGTNLHLSLDAGCVYRNNPKQGCLIALNLDAWQWKTQKNIDESDNYQY